MGKEHDTRKKALRANLILLKTEVRIDMTTFTDMLKAKGIERGYITVQKIYSGVFASEKSLDMIEPFVETLMKEYKLPFISCSGQIKSNGEVR